MKLVRGISISVSVLLFFSATELPTSSKSSNKVHAGIWIETLWCGSTTESAEDEIYLLKAWKKSDGSHDKSRVPDARDHMDHFDMNDSGPRQNLSNINIVLWEGDLADGESVLVYTAVMEKDGGMPGDLLENIGDGILEGSSAIPPGLVAGGILIGVGAILNISGIQDTDDFPGSFAVELKNQGGELIQTWQALERCQSIGVPPDHPEHYKPWEFNLMGDGSFYKVFMRAAPRPGPSFIDNIINRFFPCVFPFCRKHGKKN